MEYSTGNDFFETKELKFEDEAKNIDNSDCQTQKEIKLTHPNDFSDSEAVQDLLKQLESMEYKVTSLETQVNHVIQSVELYLLYI